MRIEARLARTADVLRLAVARERDEIGPVHSQRVQAPRDLVPVDFREPDVHERDLGDVKARELDPLRPRRRGGHVVAVELEKRTQGFPGVVMILDDEDRPAGS